MLYLVIVAGIVAGICDYGFLSLLVHTAEKLEERRRWEVLRDFITSPEFHEFEKDHACMILELEDSGHLSQEEAEESLDRLFTVRVVRKEEDE